MGAAVVVRISSRVLLLLLDGRAVLVGMAPRQQQQHLVSRVLPRSSGSRQRPQQHQQQECRVVLPGSRHSSSRSRRSTGLLVPWVLAAVRVVLLVLVLLPVVPLLLVLLVVVSHLLHL